MVRFKGYSKTATSDTTLRIDKRERIIACILAGGTLEKLSPEMSVNSSQDGQPKNLVRLTIYEHMENEDYFDWKLRMLQEADWLSNFKTWGKDNVLYATWQDTRKLRIYYKWIYKNHKKTYEQVLKYMHSPLFPAILIMENGAINKSKELLIDLGVNHGESARLLQQWFKDIFDVYTDVIKAPESHYLSFDQLSTKKILSVIKPIVQNIPSMYEKLYPHASSKAIRKTN